MAPNNILDDPVADPVTKNVLVLATVVLPNSGTDVVLNDPVPRRFNIVQLLAPPGVVVIDILPVAPCSIALLVAPNCTVAVADIVGTAGAVLFRFPVVPVVLESLDTVPSNGLLEVTSNLYCWLPDDEKFNSFNDVPVPICCIKTEPVYNEALINVYPPIFNVPLILYVSKTLLNRLASNPAKVTEGAVGAVGVPNINLRTPLVNVTTVLPSKSATSIPVNDCILFVTY